MRNTLVKEYDGTRVLLQDSCVPESTTVIWAAGVKGNIPNGVHPDFISKSHQLKTDNYHWVTSTLNVFALEDAALLEIDLYPRGFPQLAYVAINQSKNLANIFCSKSKTLFLV